MSRIKVKPNHFLPKSLMDAPMWYTSSSMSKKRSCALLNCLIQLELAADTLCIDGCRHSISPFVKQSKYSIIHIVVNKND